MKSIIGLIFLIALLVKISAFAQESNAVMQDRLVADTKQLSEMIDLYFEEMIAFSTRLKNTPQQNQTAEDAAKKQFLEETRLTIIDALKEVRNPISEIANMNPESIEISENLKLQYNLALIKASLPRFETPKASLVKKVFGIVQPQYVAEIISRSEASDLIFTEFATNDSSRDAMNLKYRISEMVETHNAIAKQLNAAKEANVYHVYPTNLNLSTAAQESLLYDAIIKGARYQFQSESKPKAMPQAESPSTLKTNKQGPDFYKMITTCFGLFAI